MKELYGYRNFITEKTDRGAIFKCLYLQNVNSD